MVVLFKGTDKSKNYAPQAVALCAGIAATRFYKKTLIVQLTTKYPVENYLIGKRKSDQNIDNKAYLFEDSGLDSLIRRVGVASFRQEHFSNAVSPVLSSENLLDVLDVSKNTEEDLIRELTSTPTIVGTIIKAAAKIYDNIFLFANGKDVELIKNILPYVDKTVTCVSQGIKEEISAESTEDMCYLVTSYDYKSSFGIRQMAKIYDNNKIFIMPYNVDFKDSYTNNDMLRFILHNVSPEEGDYSFHLIDEISKLIQHLTGSEEYEEKQYKFSLRTISRILDPETMFAGENVNIVEKKGKFGKAKKEVHIDSDSSEEIFMESNDDFSDEVYTKNKKTKKSFFGRKSKKKQKNMEEDFNDLVFENLDDYDSEDTVYNQPYEEDFDESFIKTEDVSVENIEEKANFKEKAKKIKVKKSKSTDIKILETPVIQTETVDVLEDLDDFVNVDELTETENEIIENKKVIPTTKKKRTTKKAVPISSTETLDENFVGVDKIEESTEATPVTKKRRTTKKVIEEPMEGDSVKVEELEENKQEEKVVENRKTRNVRRSTTADISGNSKKSSDKSKNIEENKEEKTIKAKTTRKSSYKKTNKDGEIISDNKNS